MRRRGIAISLGAALCLLTAGCSPASVTAGAPAAHTVRSAGTELATAAVLGRSLPVSVQSSAEMRAAGNQGPSSSVLVPVSCTVTAAKATARGTYRGGFAPAVYGRYGDVIDLYVYTRAVKGSPSGIQLADEPFTRTAPFIGGRGPWTVTVPLNTSLSSSGRPSRCVVAAQPTMDFQGAP
jgi:hypothetical protein